MTSVTLTKVLLINESKLRRKGKLENLKTNVNVISENIATKEKLYWVKRKIVQSEQMFILDHR